MLMGVDASTSAAAIHAGCRPALGDPAAAPVFNRPAVAAWSSRSMAVYGRPAAEGCSALQAACTCSHALALLPR